MTEVIMPKMGDAMEEGTLLEWLKSEGEKVKSGETLATIQTDKATLELESPGSGVLQGVLIQNGETVPVGKAIAAIVKEGESLPESWGGNGSTAPAAPSKPATEEKPTEPSGGSTEGSGIQDVPVEASERKAEVQEPSSKTTERVKASPLARKIASEKGIDIASVEGSGPGGRIVEKDVLAASERQSAAAPSERPEPIVAAKEDSEFKLNRLRQITAQRTLQSKQQVPHFYVTREVDVEKILALREMFDAEGSGRVSINDFVVKACAMALKEMPQVNASFMGTTLQIYGAVHIGLAVALEDGLTVPVLKNAHALSLRQISTKARELAVKARENKLHPDELSGSTFSISNMGMLDIDDFGAIINQPNAAILAVSTARKKVVANEDDEIEIRMRMNITASFDHRVVDGAVGAKFINLVREYLENPTRLLA